MSIHVQVHMNFNEDDDTSKINFPFTDHTQNVIEGI